MDQNQLTHREVSSDKKPQSQNAFFMASFLPAIGYWILDEYFSLTTALVGGILLSVAEIAFEKWKYKHVHALSKLNFFLIVGLGGISLIGHDGVWFKMQPALSLFALAGFMGFKLISGKGMMLELFESMPKKNTIPDIILIRMEKHMVVFFVLYAVLMTIAALYLETSVWVFFKTAGLYIAMALFSLLEFFLNKKTMKEIHLQQQKNL